MSGHHTADIPTVDGKPREDTRRVIVIATPGLCRRYFTGLYLRGRDMIRHFALCPDDPLVLAFGVHETVGDELWHALKRDHVGSVVAYSTLRDERAFYRGAS